MNPGHVSINSAETGNLKFGSPTFTSVLPQPWPAVFKPVFLGTLTDAFTLPVHVRGIFSASDNRCGIADILETAR